MSVDFGTFEAMTFDCYGTLIDWEQGILDAARELLGSAGAAVQDDELLTDFGRFESEAEAAAYRPYRDVLVDVAHRIAQARGASPSAAEKRRFAGSVVRWPPFADTVPALRALGRRYRLAIVSNVDDDLFAGSAEQLGADFEVVVTAQQVGGYKPGRAHFDAVLDRLDLPRERVLHVAQSLYHDIAPATELGFTCVWVNRRAGREGEGATPPAEASPDLEVPDMATVARLSGSLGP